LVKYVPESKAARQEVILQRGDVLFNNTNSPELVGKTAYYDLSESATFSNHMTRVRCNASILDPKYCAIALHQNWREGYFRNVCNNHVSQSSVSRSVLLETPLLVPPLPEQKRIVAKIEELLPRVNAVRECLIRVKEIMKRFRQSVLSAACSGRLTDDWREKCSDGEFAPKRLYTLATAEREQEDLSTSDQKEKKNGGDIPDGWCVVRLREILTDLKYGTSKKCTQEGKGLPVLRIPNVIKGHIDHSEMKFAELDDREYEQLRLRDGDILMVRSNGSPSLVGRTAVVTEAERGFAYAGYLIRLRLDTEKASPTYLNLALSSQEVRTQIELPMRSTSGVHNINSTEVGKLELPLPPFVEQGEIVRRVEALFNLADKIEKRFDVELPRTEKMTQAILAKAFRGELVSTEAELGRQEARVGV